MSTFFTQGVLFLIMAVAVAIWQSTTRPKALRAWSGAANRLGLAFDASALRMEGQRDGFTIGVSLINMPYVNQTVAYARFPKSLGLDYDFSLRRQMRGARLFAIEDHEVGDPDFDARILVQGYRGNQILAFLGDAERRRAIQRFFERCAGLVTQERVQVHFLGLVRDEECLVAVVENALKLAQALAQEPRKS